MIYRNDNNLYREAKRDYIKRYLLIIIPSFLWAMFTIYIVLQGQDNILFIISVTSIAGLLSIGFGVLFNYNRWKKDFYNYNIKILPDSIEIKGMIINSTINNKDINKITVDEKNIIHIHANKKKYPLSKYIENKDNLLDTLNRISKIEDGKSEKNYVEYLSIFFFCSLILVRFVPDLRLYLVIATGFIITTIISTFRYFFMPYKKRYFIIPVTINLFLLYVVVKYFIKVLDKFFIS